MYVMFVVVTITFPALLVGALLVDLVRAVVRRKPWMATRMVGFLWVYLAAEAVAVIVVFLCWVFTGSFIGIGKRLDRRCMYALQLAWARLLLGTVKALFRLEFEIEGSAVAIPGPVVVFFRHASIIDNLLPIVLLSGGHKMDLRYILKRELLRDPALDTAGNRIPNYFASRGSGDAAAEIAGVMGLTEGLTHKDGVLIYPEGTRHTAEKAKRALKGLSRGDTSIYERAKKLRHVLPPRLGGPLALLDAGTDTVFCAHYGLDGFAHVSDLWSGNLLGGKVSVKFWRVGRSEVPEGRQARALWLFDQWQAVDDWVAAAHAAG